MHFGAYLAQTPLRGPGLGPGGLGDLLDALGGGAEPAGTQASDSGLGPFASAPVQAPGLKVSPSPPHLPPPALLPRAGLHLSPP